MSNQYKLKELIEMSDKKNDIEKIREDIKKEIDEAEKFVELINFLSEREGIFALIWGIEAMAEKLMQDAHKSDEVDAIKHTVFAVLGALPFDSDDMMDAVKKIRDIDEG